MKPLNPSTNKASFSKGNLVFKHQKAITPNTLKFKFGKIRKPMNLQNITTFHPQTSTKWNHMFPQRETLHMLYNNWSELRKKSITLTRKHWGPKHLNDPETQKPLNANALRSQILASAQQQLHHRTYQKISRGQAAPAWHPVYHVNPWVMLFLVFDFVLWFGLIGLFVDSEREEV